MNIDLFQKVILVFISASGIVLARWVSNSKSPKQLKRWFLTMTFFMLLWINFAYFGMSVNNLRYARIFLKLNYGAVALFLPSFFYFYVIHFLKKDGWTDKLGKIILVISILFFLASISTNWIIHDVILQEWGREIVFGSIGLIFNFFSAFVALLVIYYSLKDYTSLSKEMKVKLRYFLSGIVIFILANLIFNVGPQILFQSVKYGIFGDFSSIFLVGFIAYAIVKYELFDIRVIATEVLTIMIWVILFSKLFISQSLTEFTIDSVVFVLIVVLGILLVKSVAREVKHRERLQELAKKLKALDKQKDEFINMAAHELRAPMTAIKGYISMVVSGDAGKITDKARSFLNDANTVNERVIRLVNNMLNVSRIEEGRMVYQMEVENLSQVIRAVFSGFRGEAERKGLKLSLKIPREIKDKVEVDPDRIHEVLANFLSNAVKYTNKGSVEVKLSQPNGSTVRLEVIDTGSGISKEEQTKLFKKFSRAESSVGKTTGTGLGLYICKLLVEKFKGEIGLESKTGKGSTFWFELPLAKTDR